jgi:accessory gene regulator protein AgrB
MKLFAFCKGVFERSPFVKKKKKKNREKSALLTMFIVYPLRLIIGDLFDNV